MPKTFDRKGNRVRARYQSTFPDLDEAPHFDNKLPDNIMYSVVIIPSQDGSPMVALVNPTLLATTQSVIEAIAAARQQYVDEGIARDAAQQVLIDAQAAMQAQLAGIVNSLSVQQTKIQTATDQNAAVIAQQAALNIQQSTMIAQLETLTQQLALRKSVVPLADVTIAASALITLTAGEKTFNVACPGVKMNDIVILTPKQQAVGYGLRGFSVPSDGNLTILEQCPVLSIGGTALVFGVVAVR